MPSRRQFLRSLFVVATAISVLGLSLVRAQQPGANQPGTQWSEAQLREAVDVARVGRKLTPKSWPNGSRVAVCLSFDADSEAPLLRDGTTSPTALSAADFGAQSGVPRILAMLDRHQIPATFFVTAVDAMLHPDMVAAIQKSGRHEIGVHGWIHETPTRVTAEEEERLLDQAIEYLTKVTGKRPLGYRAPSWAFSAATLDLIQKKGFLYDSSLQALDEPYEIASRGKLTGHRGAADRLDADRDAVPGPERPDAQPRVPVSTLQGRIRRRLPGANDVRADAAPVLERTPGADAAPRTVRDLHQIEARRVVRDGGGDRAARQGVASHSSAGRHPFRSST